MGKKRKRAEDELDRLAKKLKKLEKRLRKDKDGESISSRQNGECALPEPEEGTSDLGDIEVIEPEMAISPIQTETATCPAQLLDTLCEVQPAEGLICSDQPQPAEGECSATSNIDFNELLGEIPNHDQAYGAEIQNELAVRLEMIATQGLTKEISKEFLQKYLIPKNAKLIDAPALNPETRAAISETILKRDKGIEARQKQLAAAIACISGAVSVLLQKENNNIDIVKTLMDGLRLLCNSQFNDSNTRRSFILFNVKKEIKDELQKTKIDTLLFGKDLAETLKTAKSITKSGADLKSTPQPSTSFNKNKQPTVTSNKNLNWKPPPLNRRPRGNPRAKEPVQSQRPQPARSLHQYRAPPVPRHRR